MKFWIILCLLAAVVAEEEETPEKKSQAPENTQNTNPALTQANPPFNQPFFAPSPLFGNKDSLAAVPFTGFPGNVPSIQNIPIQPSNPEFLTPSQGIINSALPNFQVTRTVLPGTSPVANAIPSQFPISTNSIQSQFPLAANVLSSIPAVVNGINPHFPNAVTSIIPPVAGLQGISPETLKYHPISSGVPIINASPYRVLPQESLANFQAHNLQAAQSIVPATLSPIQSYPSSVLTSLPNGILTSSQGILKTPPATSQSISNISTLPVDKLNAGPLPSVFRHA